MEFYNTVLDNGLTVIGEQRESAVSVGLGFFVRTGARDETPEVSGVSHFLEHMMFKGTARRSALDVTYALGAIGAQANAYTSEEATVYYMAILPEYFNKGIELLCDMLRPSLDPHEFFTEKKVILEEIALYEDRPTYVLYEKALATHFGAHLAGNSVLGTHDSVSALSRAQMKYYFDERYSPSNLIFAASGQFDWAKVVDAAEKYCGKWERFETSRELSRHEPVKTVETITKDNLQRAHVCMLSAGPAARDESRYAAQLLSCVLGDRGGSALYWALVDTGIAEGASVDIDDMDGTGVVMGFITVSPDRLKEAVAIYTDVVSKPLEFSDEDLLRAKTKVQTRLVLEGESSMRRLMAIGNNWLYREAYSTLQEEIEKFDSVTREEIAAVAAEYSFVPETVVRLVAPEFVDSID